jgi:hypothetical protein
VHTIHLESFTWIFLPVCSPKLTFLGIGFGPYSICHGCMAEDIKGFGWKCTRCVHYTLCSSCYFSGKHLLDHRFARFDTINLRSVTVIIFPHVHCTTFAIVVHYFVALEPCTCNKIYIILILYLHDVSTITCNKVKHAQSK